MKLKKAVLTLISVLLLFAFAADTQAQVLAEDFSSEPIAVFTQSPIVHRGDCYDFENADYYVRYVYLYAGQHTIAGRVTISVQRREGRYQNLRVLYLTGGNGWDILESHLYVGTGAPSKMAPGRFPYQQSSPNGLKRHDYVVPLESPGGSFDHLYIAIHAVVKKVGGDMVSPKGDVIVDGQEETAWGFKTVNGWYPVIDKKDDLNQYGEPWGVIFPKKNKQWPAYLMIALPYDQNNATFDCPKPLYLTVEY